MDSARSPGSTVVPHILLIYVAIFDNSAKTNKQRNKQKAAELQGLWLLNLHKIFTTLELFYSIIHKLHIPLQCNQCNDPKTKKQHTPKLLQKSFIGNAFTSLAVMYQQNPIKSLACKISKLGVFCLFVLFLKGPVKITAAVHCKQLQNNYIRSMRCRQVRYVSVLNG